MDPAAGVGIRSRSQRLHHQTEQEGEEDWLSSPLSPAVFRDGKFIVLDELTLNEAKTKNFVNVMKNLNVAKALVVLNENNENVMRSARNVADVKTCSRKHHQRI